jgi:SAM-dependent methyltransferase
MMDPIRAWNSTDGQPRDPTSWLGSDYYNQCHRLFRQLTNQDELMLEHVVTSSRGQGDLRVLSVGCGAGLFEIPLLKRLGADGLSVRQFVGIDVSVSACETLERKMKATFPGRMVFDVQPKSFTEYATDERFELILFNHVMEYVRDEIGNWLGRSLQLISAVGRVIIFSPDRGDINHVYETIAPDQSGFTPALSDDIRGELERRSIQFESVSLVGDCDVRLLNGPNENPDQVQLLSFLTQQDCRKLSARARHELTTRFLTLADSSFKLRHPTTSFVLASAHHSRG